MRVGTSLVHAGARLVQNKALPHICVAGWTYFGLQVRFLATAASGLGSVENCVGIVWVVTVRSSRVSDALGKNPLGRLTRKPDGSPQSEGVQGLNRLVPWRKRVGQVTWAR